MKNYKYLTAFLVLIFVGVVALFLLQKTQIDGFQSQLPSEILLINMDSRTDRLESFQNHFDMSDASKYMKLHRMSAVVGKDVDWKSLVTPKATKDMDKLLQTGKRNHHDQLTIGAIGCYLSHLKALEYVVETNKPAIVCEDDLILPSDFYEKMKAGLLLLPTDALLLFHVLCNGWEEHKCIRLKDNFYEVHRFWSMACYYVTPTVAKTILENAKPLDIQIDAMLSQLVKKDALKIYAYPITKTELALGTDIQVPIQANK